jgi:hypothetical protein
MSLSSILDVGYMKLIEEKAMVEISRERSGAAPTLARRFIFLITTGQVVSDW